MKIKQWGDIWEEKIKAQNEVGIIHGSNSSIKKVLRELKNDSDLFSKWIFPKLKKSSTILDCGTGPMARHGIFFSENGYNVTGVDISKTTLKSAKKWAMKKNQKIRFIKANLIDLSEIKEKFDLVFCTQTFWHIPAYLSLEVLKQFRNKVKEEGYCLVQIGVEKEKTLFKLINDFLYQSLFLLKKKFHTVFPVNCSSYTEEEIKDLVWRAGFKLVDRKGIFFLLQRKKIMIKNKNER